MAQLVIIKTPWWKKGVKGMAFWAPLAAMQVTAVAGGGYFYHHLTELEQGPLVSGNRVTGEPVRIAAADKPMPPPEPVALAIPVSESGADGGSRFMQAGANFSSLLQIAAVAPGLDGMVTHSDVDSGVLKAVIGGQIAHQAKQQADDEPEPIAEAPEAPFETPEPARASGKKPVPENNMADQIGPGLEDELTAAANRYGLTITPLQKRLRK